MHIKRTGLTRKEPVKPVEQVVYDEVHNSDSISSLYYCLTTNTAYGPVVQ